jgi:hypothetical protein
METDTKVLESLNDKKQFEMYFDATKTESAGYYTVRIANNAVMHRTAAWQYADGTCSNFFIGIYGEMICEFTCRRITPDPEDDTHYLSWKMYDVPHPCKGAWRLTSVDDDHGKKRVRTT